MDKPLQHSFAPMGKQDEKEPLTPMAEEFMKKSTQQPKVETKPVEPQKPAQHAEVVTTPEKNNPVDNSSEVIDVTSAPTQNAAPQQTEADWEASIAKQRKEREEAAKRAEQLAASSVNTTLPPPAPPVTPEDTKKAKAKNASSIIFTDIGTKEEFKATFEKIQNDDTRLASEKDADPQEALVGLALCETLGMKTKQHDLLTKFINAINKNTEEVSKLSKCVKELGLSKIKPNIPTSDGPKVLSGDAALATVIARTKGVYRIPLYNSGFWISVKPPTLSELDAFVREVDTDFKEFGRILGSHYHLVFDLFIKQKLMDLVSNNIINSNFDNFKNKNALLDVISINDYDTIAWAFCTMIYSDGINIGVFCTNPECAYKDDSQYIDLARCNYINHDVFNADASAWMLTGFGPKMVKTAKDLLHYRTNILKGSKSVKDISGDNMYTFEVPTMGRYFAIGAELIESITKGVHSETDVTNEQLANEITYNVYKMLTPWISKMTMLDNGVTQFITSDSKAIMESLDIGYGETSNVYEEVENFIKDTRVCYFGTTLLKCPKCGKVPNFSKDNMFVFDMGHLFFGLSYLQLGRIGENI